MSDYLDINNEELLKDFFSEAEQQVDMLESNILVIENDPENHDAIDEIFRAAHTLKGGSATVEMNELSGFTHKVEDLLDAIRSGTVKVTESVVDLLLRALDVIKAMLSARADGGVYDEDVSGIVSELEGLIPKKDSSKNAWLSSDKQQVSKYDSDPLCGFHFTSRGFYDLFTGLIDVRSKRWAVRTQCKPFLLISGQDDPIGGYGKGVLWIRDRLKAAGRDVTCILYPKKRHEILNESDCGKVYTDIVSWILREVENG